jgi:uncharacterized integral membrane protein
MAYLIVAIVAVAVSVFTLQNTAEVTVTFLFWQIARVPLAAVVLFSLAAGVVLAGVPLWLQRWRLRSRLRALESRVVPPASPSDSRPDTAKPDTSKSDTA